MRGPLSVRLAKNTSPEPNSGCWLWCGAAASKGRYGSIRDGDKILSVHRVAWEIAFGKIPDEMQVLHKCDVMLCVNPDHLFLGTNDDNIADKVAKGRQAKGTTLVMTRAKLTEAQVLAIRADTRTHKAIADDYKLDASNVGYIKARKTWRHV